VDDVLGREYPQSGAREVSAGTLALHNVTRAFGGTRAVDDVSLEIGAGELLALIGASGSGKTTTLRIVAGHDVPDEGQVMLDGQDITNLPPQRRDFGMVFQHYALFPHMSVEDNVAFGLEARGFNKSIRTERARALLSSVGLDGAGKRSVQSLSGGEQQRVALARALVVEPRALLLDEPLSNLDPTLRRTMRAELREMLRRLRVTALFVTHDQDDAFAIADRVALMKKGKLLQVGSPEDLYDRPASRDVAEFIGRATLFPAVDCGTHAIITLNGVERRVGVVAERGPGGKPFVDAAVVLRPEALAFTSPGAETAFPGTIVGRRFSGTTMTYDVLLEGEMTVEVASQERTMREGDRVGVAIVRDPVPLVSS
jgi:ABC-type Fe3+/spermidine/putrescine transport system ATPase subunit